MVFLAASEVSSSREFLSRLRDPRNKIEKGPDLASRIDDCLDLDQLGPVERRQLVHILALDLKYTGASRDLSTLFGIAHLDDNSRGIVSLLKGVVACNGTAKKLDLKFLRARARKRLLDSACIDDRLAYDLGVV